MKPLTVHMANATILRRAPRVAAKLTAAFVMGVGCGVIGYGYFVILVGRMH
jgi:hypothetical protein